MEFFLDAPEARRVLPVETRLLDLQAEPYPDGKRLRVILEVTPFQEKPVITLALSNFADEVVAETTIIEPITWQIELTLHIRKTDKIAGGLLNLQAILSYPDLGKVDQRDLSVEIPTLKV
jgi:hypothetical protein